jgi:hypothetical protein
MVYMPAMVRGKGDDRMSEQKHTPGPWESGNGTTSIYGSDGKEVARRIWHGPQDDERSLANARLIAASPEVLEALKGLRELHAMRGENRSETWERIAELFYNETGILAPGKDQPAAMCGTPTREERDTAYRDWLDARVDAATAAIAKATGGAA